MHLYPAYDSDVLGMEVVYHLLRVGEFLGIPNEVVDASAPFRVYIDGTHRNVPIKKSLHEIDDIGLVGAMVIKPHPMVVLPDH